MSENLIPESEIIPVDSSETYGFTNLDFLKSSAWDPLDIPAVTREPLQREVSEIAQLPSGLRAVDLAQYALYLGNGLIRPLGNTSLELGRINTPPGEHSEKDQKIIEDFLLSSALNNELLQTYSALSSDSALIATTVGYTADFTSKDTACLYALQKIAAMPDNIKYERLSKEDIAAAERVLRAFIAIWVHGRSLIPLLDAPESVE
ncbi:hypothetical protein COU91_01130 [Candidatus Saccharibacteria bacterium CG10_big_fil_rev_8_21_14_0_10_47_8]|nr:MAG: hypothetical protein COU91_01130 [Candidatus Saccharibacteria bacterium CG10_big_fil_rev_8_21_14_0_10_47_8]